MDFIKVKYLKLPWQKTAYASHIHYYKIKLTLKKRDRDRNKNLTWILKNISLVQIALKPIIFEFSSIKSIL